MATTITGTTIDVGPNKLVANSAGNVGIGTASPAKPLDVTGDIRTSTGILFGTDTAAANALDDYEEGTFTHSVNGASNKQFDTGYYTKIGNQVFFHFYTGTFTATAVAANFSGLPFTAMSGTAAYTAFYSAHNTAVSNSIGGYVAVNQTLGQFITDGTSSAPNYISGGSKLMMVAGTYNTN